MKPSLAAISAQIGASTRPQIYEPTTTDWGKAVNNFLDSYQKAQERGMTQEAWQREKDEQDRHNAFRQEYGDAIARGDVPGSLAAIAKSDPFKHWQISTELENTDKKNKLAWAQLAFEKDQLEKKMASERLKQQEQENAFDTKGAMELRKEFRTANKDFFTIGDAFSKIQKNYENPTAAGDLSLIFNYMKMLDPSSVVRESEFSNAENARAWFAANGVPTSFRLAYDKARKGLRLTDDQRRDFYKVAGDIMRSQGQRFDNESQYYSDIAKQSRIDPQFVVYNPYQEVISKLNDVSLSEASKPQESTRGLAKIRKILGVMDPTTKSQGGASGKKDFASMSDEELTEGLR